MYKIIETIDRYPFVVMLLVNITTGEKRYWCIDDVHADDLCAEYHVRNLHGLILDQLPASGSWIKRQDINLI